MELSPKFIDKFVQAIFQGKVFSKYRTGWYYWIIDSKYRTKVRMDRIIQNDIDERNPFVVDTALKYSKYKDDIAIIKILKYVSRRIKYTPDYDLYGKPEYWAGAYETWNNQKGDCDDINKLIAIMGIYSGIPWYKFFHVIGWIKINGINIYHYYVLYFSTELNDLFVLDAAIPNIDFAEIRYKDTFRPDVNKYGEITYIWNNKVIIKPDVMIW